MPAPAERLRFRWPATVVPVSLADQVAALVLEARAGGGQVDVEQLVAIPRVAAAIRRRELLEEVDDFRRKRSITVLDACERVSRRHGLPANTLRSWWAARDVDQRDGKAHQRQSPQVFSQPNQPVESGIGIDQG